MFIIESEIRPEPILRLRSGIDARSQADTDALAQIQFDAAVAANERRRREAEDDEPDYDDSTYHQHDGTFADNRP